VPSPTVNIAEAFSYVVVAPVQVTSSRDHPAGRSVSVIVNCSVGIWLVQLSPPLRSKVTALSPVQAPPSKAKLNSSSVAVTVFLVTVRLPNSSWLTFTDKLCWPTPTQFNSTARVCKEEPEKLPAPLPLPWSSALA